MLLLTVITIVSISGIIYGVAKNNRKMIITWSIVLAIVWVLSGVYYYIGLKNPY